MAKTVYGRRHALDDERQTDKHDIITTASDLGCLIISTIVSSVVITTMLLVGSFVLSLFQKRLSRPPRPRA